MSRLYGYEDCVQIRDTGIEQRDLKCVLVNVLL